MTNDSCIVTSSTSSTNETKKLRFGHVVIRDMPMELGEHPASEGAPVTIGWEPESTRHTNVDLFELCKNSRSKKEFKLSVLDRFGILIRAGYSINEIADACEQSTKILQQRRATQRSQKWEIFQGIGMQAGRSIKNLAKKTTYGGLAA
jgi:hypothetical protein